MFGTLKAGCPRCDDGPQDTTAAGQSRVGTPESRVPAEVEARSPGVRSVRRKLRAGARAGAVRRSWRAVQQVRDAVSRFRRAAARENESGGTTATPPPR